MTARRLPLLALLSVAAAVAAAPAHAADDRVIGAGASAGGVDLSGLTIDAAAARLQQVLGPQVAASVTVTVARRSFTLGAARAKVRFDALTTAKRAYYAARDRGPVIPANPSGGVVSGLSVPLKLSHSRLAVRAWTNGIRDEITKTPRNATVTLGLTRMRIRGSHKGYTVDAPALAARVDAALDDPAQPRRIVQKVVRLNPKTNIAALRRQYGTVLTVDRANFRLRLFKGLRVRKTYRIALGMAGYDTPPGRYAIQSKQVNPAWYVPTSAWAGSLGGQVVPGGAPNNPLKARWLGVNGSVGIHGTAEDWSIGTRASHGCIRMHVSDVVDLYPRVPVGAPVLIR